MTNLPTLQQTSDFLSHLSSHPRFQLYSLLIASLLFFLYIRYRWSQRFITISHSNGSKTSIKRQAINRMIQNICASYPIIYRSHAHLSQKFGKFHITLHLRLQSPDHIHSTLSTLQDHIRQTTQDILGIPHIHSINLVITGFKFSPLPTSLPPKSPSS